MRWGKALAAALLVAASGCTVRPKVSDTGYTGTWARGNDRVRSTISIVRHGDGYRFRWSKSSYDGKFAVRCGWDGACVETLNGVSVASHRFATALDRGTGTLKVSVVESRLVPEKLDLRYVDELTVEDGGKVLRSTTIERDGVVLDAGGGRPTRTFDKVADAVAVAAPAGSRR